ncbi:MAG: DNA repair protein RecO [Betaproteobacteria bacterium]|jgi:DNA repair protein RecO (recombination protein O)|nr:DNA repair protein RecO [Betaproteobacteria bacterium]
MRERQRVDGEQSFVLHSYPFRETSLLVEIFSRRFGRVALLAKGARRPRSALRGALLAFQPLAIGWAGKGEVRTLMKAEWRGGQPLLAGEALFCGFYLNELLLRLLPREDAHDELFDAYAEALEALARGALPAPVLRSFEKRLLKELGYALTLDREPATGASVDPATMYRYEPERGPVPVGSGSARGATDGPLFSGRALLEIARENYADPHTLQQGKILMRLIINHRLDQRPLQSRRVFEALQEL